MSATLEGAVEKLNTKMDGAGFAGTAKFEIANEGAIVVDENGARVSDDAADVTLSADADTFQSMLEGDTDPTSAFMSGKLTVEGDMGMAMQLAAALA